LTKDHDNTVALTFKRCTKCGEETPLDEFSRNKTRPDGHQNACKECFRSYCSAHYAAHREERAAYRAAHRDEIAASNAAYRAAHSEQGAAYAAAYRAAHPEQGAAYYAAHRDEIAAYYAAHRDEKAAYQSAYYAANRDERAAYQAAYCTANRDEIAARQAAYRAAHPEKRAAHHRNRRARKRAAPGKHTAADIQQLLLFQKKKCACCRKSIAKSYHVDHVIPLSKGGSNDPHNLQLLCPTCNLKKHDKHPIDFMQSLGMLL
jgi:5-methylcytosine-specific restriction endonuclease McrA